MDSMASLDTDVGLQSSPSGSERRLTPASTFSFNPEAKEFTPLMASADFAADALFLPAPDPPEFALRPATRALPDVLESTLAAMSGEKTEEAFPEWKGDGAESAGVSYCEALGQPSFALPPFGHLMPPVGMEWNGGVPDCVNPHLMPPGAFVAVVPAPLAMPMGDFPAECVAADELPDSPRSLRTAGADD